MKYEKQKVNKKINFYIKNYIKSIKNTIVLWEIFIVFINLKQFSN